MMFGKNASVKLVAAGGVPMEEVSSTALLAGIGFDPLGLIADSAIDKERSAASDMRDTRVVMLASLIGKLNPILGAKHMIPSTIALFFILATCVEAMNGIDLLIADVETDLSVLDVAAPCAVEGLMKAEADLADLQGLRVKNEQGDAWLPGCFGNLGVRGALAA
jgi:hypothetical protein